MRRFSIGALILALFIPLLIGSLSALIAAQGMSAYGEMSKPPYRRRHGHFRLPGRYYTL